MPNNQSEYKELYKTILEIGKSRINEGVSYYKLKEDLKNKGFIIDSCSELAIKKFFCDNFFHLSNHRKPEPTPKNIERYHKNCNFVMTGEACLTLERLIEIKQLKKSSNFNFWIAIISILLGVAAQIPDWINFLKPSNTKSGQFEQVNLNLSETTKETLKSKPYQYQNHPTQQNYDKTKKGGFDSNNTNPNQLKPNDKKSVTK